MELSVGISNYYKEIGSFTIETTPQGLRKKILPYTRLDFITASGLSIIFLVKQVAVSLFFLVVNVLTCGLNRSYRASLQENCVKGCTYFGAIILGYSGALFPQTVNEQFLHIPPQGLSIPWRL